jgi:hypothetical protein
VFFGNDIANASMSPIENHSSRYAAPASPTKLIRLDDHQLSIRILQDHHQIDSPDDPFLFQIKQLGSDRTGELVPGNLIIR